MIGALGKHTIQLRGSGYPRLLLYWDDMHGVLWAFARHVYCEAVNDRVYW